MRVESLRLRDFRNYDHLELRPGSGLNVLVGENAQGKSNLLEALYLLTTTRSLRASRESEMIRSGQEQATVSAHVLREKEADVDLEVTVLKTDRKAIRINGARRPRVIELLGRLNAVYFGSVDLAIVGGEPTARRRFLNREISQISPKYVFDLASYRKALEQRNRLLREMRDRPYADDALEAWSEQIVRYGAPLLEKRRFFLDRLAPIADEIHRRLTDGAESLAIRYAPGISVPDDRCESATADSFRSQLAENRREELRRGVTLLGPQRDDIRFLIDGADARLYASMGQQRTVVLSLKLAQFRLMKEYVGEAPLMLLDDVMSDLDDRRRSHLLEWIQAESQTFLTCTNLHAFPPAILRGADLHTISAGRVTPLKQERTADGEEPSHAVELAIPRRKSGRRAHAGGPA